jgi:hypothetical protein
MKRDLSRRDLVASAVAAALAGVALPGRGLAFGTNTRVDIAELDLGAGTSSRPDAWERLLHEVEQTTSVRCQSRPARVKPDAADFFFHPFTVVLGSGAFAMPNEKAIEQISRFLSYGGFLLFDETSGSDGSGFDRSVRDLCRVLFPTRPLAPIPSDHSIYRSFFLLDRPVGRIARHPYLEGITVGGMEGKGGFTPLVYCRNDLSGALDRAADGRHRNPVEPGGEEQRRSAIKLGINLVMYCITSDYKKDQAHVKALMDDHRLQEDDWETE